MHGYQFDVGSTNRVSRHIKHHKLNVVCFFNGAAPCQPENMHESRRYLSNSVRDGGYCYPASHNSTSLAATLGSPPTALFISEANLGECLVLCSFHPYPSPFPQLESLERRLWKNNRVNCHTSTRQTVPGKTIGFTQYADDA